ELPERFVRAPPDRIRLVQRHDDAVLHTLERSDRYPERDPRLAVLDRHLGDVPGTASHIGREQRCGAVARTLNPIPDLPWLPDDRRCRDPHAVEGDLTHVLAEPALLPPDADAVRLRVHQEQRDAVRAASPRSGGD